MRGKRGLTRAEERDGWVGAGRRGDRTRRGAVEVRRGWERRGMCSTEGRGGGREGRRGEDSDEDEEDDGGGREEAVGGNVSSAKP